MNNRLQEYAIKSFFKEKYFLNYTI